ncbi:MAG: hypothetical protein ACE5GW_05185, partial [Planctomycetota bacterium]
MKGGTVPARGRLPGGLAALFVVLLVGVGCSIVIDGPRWGWGNPTSWVTGERSFSFSAAEVDRVRCTTHNGSIVASTTSPAAARSLCPAP